MDYNQNQTGNAQPQAQPNPYAPPQSEVQNSYVQPQMNNQNIYAQPQMNNQSAYAQPQMNEQNPYVQQVYYQNQPAYEQPQMQQNYAQGYQNGQQYPQQAPPVMNQDAPVDSKGMSVEDRANGKRLCIISLCCYALPYAIYLISCFISAVTDASYLNSFGKIDNALSKILEVFTGASGLGVVAAYVLMIVARVKYPKYTFAKVLMWIYIGLFILGVISAILLIVFVWVICSSCASTGCPG